MQHNLRNGVRGLSHRRAPSLTLHLDPHGQRIPNASARSLGSLAQAPSTRSAAAFKLNHATSGALSEEKDEHFARMLMFGKPGAGKGTLTARLTQKYDILTLSTGDLLRRHIAEGTEVGKEAEAIIARGGLVPDEVVLKVVTSKLDSLQNKVTISCSAILLSSAHFFY